MTRRKQQWPAADLSGKLAESDHRAREGDCTDQDADVDLYLMNGLLDARERGRGIQKVGITYQYCSQTYQTVHQSDQFRHLGHFDLFGRKDTDCTTDRDTNDQGEVTGFSHLRTKHCRENRDGHPEDAVEVSLAGCFRIGKAAKAQNEKNGRRNIGDRNKSC